MTSGGQIMFREGGGHYCCANTVYCLGLYVGYSGQKFSPGFLSQYIPAANVVDSVEVIKFWNILKEIWVLLKCFFNVGLQDDLTHKHRKNPQILS